ncbi:MAG: hydrogenase maturation nickel metallochaperone HypA [Chloroflexi bacterium]|nr:MAG: hydrogenase maturation nickel metallochaperone HypA [Chloroflexota bacterium]
MTMHEVGIAHNLLALAAQNIPDADRVEVRSLKIRLGPLAGVSQEELRFGFEVAAHGTPFAGARLDVEETPAIIYCSHCRQEFVLPDGELLVCPACATASVQVVRGKELTLVAIEVAEDDDTS